MKEETYEKLDSTVIGIRYIPTFKIADDFGSIADDILYTKNAFFSTKVFSHVTISGPFEMVFIDEKKKNDKLTINNANIILEMSFDESNVEEDLIHIRNAFKKEILYGVIKKYKIKEISRIGHITKRTLHSSKFSKDIVNAASKMEGARDLHLKFSKKIPVEEAIFKKDINDYNNIIHTIEKGLDKDEFSVSLDYQRYYEPALESSDDIEYDNFMKDADSYYFKEFYSWLNEICEK